MLRPLLLSATPVNQLELVKSLKLSYFPKLTWVTAKFELEFEFSNFKFFLFFPRITWVPHKLELEFSKFPTFPFPPKITWVPHQLRFEFSNFKLFLFFLK